jgi:hypothetical protein
VNHDDFICLECVTDGSQFIDRTLSDWLDSLDEGQRRKFIDAFYEVLLATKTETIAELTTDWFKHAGIMVKSLHDSDPETKQLLMQAFQLLIKSARANMPEINPVKQISDHFRKLRTSSDKDQ